MIFHKTNGYSLIEVLIAMFIFSFVSLSILQTYLLTISGEENNKAYYFAVKLADEKLKYMNKQRILKNRLNIINEYIKYNISSNRNITYNRITSIEKIKNNLLYISIKISWEIKRKKKSYELKTYL